MGNVFSKLNVTLKAWAFPIALLGLWQWCVNNQWVPLTLSSPELIGDAFTEYAKSGELFIHSAISIKRAILGLWFGSIIGLLIGFLMASTRVNNRIFTPTFRALMQISAFAWIPLISVWFGTTEQARVIFISFVVIFPVALNTYEGIVGVPHAYREASQVLRLSRFRENVMVVLPSATPSILAGLELGMLYAWLATIGAELLMGNGYGVGAMMLAGQALFRMEVVFMGVIVCGVVGFGIAIITKLLNERLIKDGSGAIK